MRILAVFLIVVLLVGCGPSQESSLATWEQTQGEIRALFNRVEQLKAQLQADFDSDMTQEDPATFLLSQESLVQQNLKSRRDILSSAKELLNKLNDLPEDHLDEAMLRQRTSQAEYIELSLTGLDSEKAFFDQIATGKFMQDKLNQAAETIESNRDAQENQLKNDAPLPVETPSETPTENQVFTPKYRLNQASQLFEPIGDSPAKAVLLTFDDVPITGDAKQSLAIAKHLKEQNVPAIFFVYGAYLNSEVGKQTVKEIHDMGFAIGNHSQNHPDLTTLSEDGIRQELQILNDQIVEITGEKPRYFRPPYGATNPTVSAIAREEGMIPMNWTYGYDWEGDYQKADDLADIMVNTNLLTPGANLLLHDRQNTAEAISRIVTGLKDKGYSFIIPEEISDEAN